MEMKPPPIPHYFSWQMLPPDRFHNFNLFNAGSSKALHVRVEPENSTRIEPRGFYEPIINASDTSARFKIERAGGARRPSVRITWQDTERKNYSVIMEVEI